MAIRFQCPSCQGKLKVGSHKAGAKKSCPLCGAELTVPMQSEDQAASQSSSPEQEAEDSFLDAIVVDASQIRVDRSAAIRGSREDAPLTLPRQAVYAVGGLLLVVAAFFFLFGVLVGRVSVQRTEATRPLPPARTKTIVTGTVHRRLNNQREPDQGAVVILLPTDASPETTIDGSKLHPDQFTGSSMPEAQVIRTFGGDVVGVDGQGRFRSTLAAGRTYQILVVSKNVDSAAEVDRQLRARWGELFVPVEPLVAGRAFKLLEVETRGASQSLDPVLLN